MVPFEDSTIATSEYVSQVILSLKSRTRLLPRMGIKYIYELGFIDLNDCTFSQKNIENTSKVF